VRFTLAGPTLSGAEWPAFFAPRQNDCAYNRALAGRPIARLLGQVIGDAYPGQLKSFHALALLMKSNVFRTDNSEGQAH
jgi:hypothetical protein